jgi:ATP/maltotriose-dependent transcriptional regulator MalT/DNA-binding SARP family transcriptional activator
LHLVEQQSQALRHKFRAPGVPRGSLVRPRLDRQLSELFDAYSVVEMIGAPGCGKTVQAQLYAPHSGGKLAWLTLDQHDLSASGLVFDLATALGPVAGDTVETARRALQREGTAEEAAAILASAVGGSDCLFVIDDCQQIVDSADAAATLDTFLEYVPERMRVLLLAREEMPWPLQKRYVHGQIAQVDDATLNLTYDETVDYVRGLAGSEEQAGRIFASTGGWVAGVALASRFGVEHEPNPRDLSTYLQKQVLEPLPLEEQDFLLDTSVADAVTSEVAVALCGTEGQRLFGAALSLRLPATSISGNTIVYHSLFRSFLQARLIQLSPERHGAKLRSYAAHLSAARHFTEAAEVLFSVGDLSAAGDAARQALPSLFAQANWPVLRRWLGALGEESVRSDPLLLGAQIRTVHGLREFNRARALVRQLDGEGRLRGAIEADPSLLGTAAWALQSHPQEVLTLLDKFDGDQRADVVRYMTETTTGSRPASPPIVDDVGDVERMLSWGFFLQGRLSDLARLEVSDGDTPVLNPNVVLAPAIRGQADAARSLWLRVPAEIRERPHSRFIEAVVDLASGERTSALKHLRQALADSHRSGFSLGPVYEIFVGYALLADGSPDAAIEQLLPLLDAMSRSGETAYVEWAQCFLGTAYLHAGREAEALLMLREVVRSMTRCQRRLFLPMAAAALAEAEARIGSPEAAHEAAQHAYHIAQLTSSFAVLVQTVRMFPDVQRREVAHNPEDSRWLRLVASPSVRSRPEPAAQVREPPSPQQPQHSEHAALRIQPFGRDWDLYLNGVPAHIGRTKILELAAVLALSPDGIDRLQLQQRLFPEAEQANRGNHFRQIVYKLRHGTGVSLERHGNLVRLPEGLEITSDDIAFERLLETANSLSGSARTEQLRGALRLVTGRYLEGSVLPWAEERRHYLDIVFEEGRLELARLFLDSGQHDASRAECEAVLEANRYSDPAYRLLFSIERQVGSESAALAVYRRATEALAELGLKPGDARRMLERPAAAAGDADRRERARRRVARAG